MNERLKSRTILRIDRRKYRTVPHTLIALFGMCLCGCFTSTDSTNRIPISGKPLRLVFITCAVDAPFFVPLRQGMNDAAGMLGVQCDFKGTPGVDVKSQAEMVRQAVRDGYDGIALNIIDPVALDDVVQEAMDAAVPVVAFNVDDQATPNARMASVNQRLYEAGVALGKHVSPWVTAGSSVLLMMHDEGVSALNDRRRGIQDALQSAQVKWTTLVTGNQSDRGAEVVAKALRQNPDIHIVLGTGQSDTEAAGLAIRQSFPGKGYWAAGFDLSPTTLELIRAGHILCTIDQQPYIQGFYPVVQLTHYLRYGIRPSSIDAGAAIIDKSNVEEVSKLTQQHIR